MQEVDPEAYNNLIKRMPGINTAAHLGADDQFYIKELPFMFNSWIEYRDFLLEKMIAPRNRKMFYYYFKSQDLEFTDIPEELNLNINYDNMIKSQINAILCNDFEGTKLKNLQTRASSKVTRNLRKQRQGKI